MSSFPITRRKFLAGSILAGATGAYGLANYSRHIEPHELSIEQVELSLPRLVPELDGFKIALLSDFHYGAYIEDLIKDAVASANQANVDVAFLTGDFVSWRHDHGARGEQDADACAAILSGLNAGLGKIAVLGNHDYAPRAQIVTEPLKAHGIHVLRNAAVPIEKNNSRIWIAGIDDALEGRPDLAAALKDVPKAEPAILLAHEPDFADVVRRYPVDLQVSGHSHGGQVRLPFVGAPILPEMGQRYPMGSYNFGNLQLYTNRGLGMISPRIRFNCAPELTLLTLRSPRAAAATAASAY